MIIRQLAALVCLGAAVLSGVPIVSDVAGFLYLFILPGYILADLLRFSSRGFWERLLHIVGLSIAFTLLVGVVNNGLYTWLHIPQPLAKLPMLMTFTVVLLACSVASSLRRKLRPRHIVVWPRGKWLAMYIIPCIFPILAAMGATALNNGGSNWLTLLLLGAIATYIMSLFIMRGRLPEGLLLPSLFMIALSLLLAVSLRSWHIAGYDISQEFQVFQLTKHDLLWSMAHFQDPYNACLSITILPTIVSQFMHISDEYIFKFLFQVLFALTPLAIYLLVRRFGDKRIALLASLFFVSQVWFFQGMPALVRQEFGMLFFVLILLVLFMTELPKLVRYPVVMIYGVAMVMSHYSTSYIAIALFVLTYVIGRLASLLRRKSNKQKAVRVVRSITLPFILFLVAAVGVWNVAVTNTAGALGSFVDHSSTSIGHIFSGDIVTHAISKVVYTTPPVPALDQYAAQRTATFKVEWPELEYYPQTSISSQLLQPVDFPGTDDKLGDVAHQLGALGFRVVKIILNNIFIVFGVALLCYAWFKKRFVQGEFLWLSVAGFVLLALLLLLPSALKEYNLERLYFQLLIVWAFAGICGGLYLLGSAYRKRVPYAILALAFCLQLLFYSGGIFTFTGGPATIMLNNYGEDYQKFYTQEGEVLGAKWLGARYNGKLIYTNGPGRNKLWAYGMISKDDIISETLPSVVAKNAYVFESAINIQGGAALYIYNDDEYSYVYPQKFMDDVKDEVYSSGTARVYQ